MQDRKQLLKELKEIAKQRGGRCLSNEYVNSTSKLLFECKDGHQFESCRNYLKDGNWCPFCAGRGRTIQDLEELAIQKGGRCLSSKFLGMKKKHLWECAEGHRWEAVPQNIKTLGRWCPVCGRKKSDKNRRKYTLEDMKCLAKSRGGLCLSSNFESVIKKLIWECEQGHTWKATPHHIQQGKWCPVCAWKIRAEKRKTHTIEEMQIFAIKKGGQCLSGIFVSVKELLLWECREGHQWKANADNILNGGKWCPVCAGTQKKTIEEMKKLAQERGGECLSDKYQGVHEKLQWQCQEGHHWETVPSVVIRGGWCPECSNGLGERICRAFFEQLFDSSFKKARPKWLRSFDGHQMELDGYSPSLALAFEHQGLQHYQKVKYFNASDAKLLEIQNRDRLKQNLCESQNITLIQIPSILDILGIDNLKSFISNALQEKGISLPSDYEKKEIDLRQIYCPNRLGELQKIAIQRGGKLISEKYLGIFEHLEWECLQGHRFIAAPNNVKNSGSWCPICIGRGKTIQDMKEVAAQRGGKCLSDVYANNITSLLWECKESHQWWARPSNILFGTWCPECAKKERGLKRRTHTIEEMRQLAIKRNGKCLSPEYQGTKTKLLWECEKGHQWEAIPETILRSKTWCLICSKRKILKKET